MAIEALVCNLAALALDPLSRPLAVPRNSGVMWSGSRYAEPVYGQHFLDALDLMADPAVGIIESLQRGYSFGAQGGRPSTVAPGLSFASFVPANIVQWSAFHRIPAAETIVLKELKQEADEAAEPLDYPDCSTRPDWLGSWRAELLEINGWLATALFWLVGDDAPGQGEPVDPTRRVLRRIFTGAKGAGSAERWGRGGGRLYDGFWIDMPKTERFRRIRIGSAVCPSEEHVAQVDLKQFNPRAAYLHKNLRVPSGDLYDIRGDGSCRVGFKKMVNALLSSNKPLRRWPRDLQDSSDFPKGTRALDVIREVETYHAPIAHLFGTGIGARLVMYESTIIIDALRRLLRQNVVALPVHDALWCAQSESVCVSVALQEAALEFADWFSVQTSIDIS